MKKSNKKGLPLALEIVGVAVLVLVLVAIVGLFVWKRRTARRKQINLKYNPNDTRTIVKEKKVKNEE